MQVLITDDSQGTNTRSAKLFPPLPLQAGHTPSVGGSPTLSPPPSRCIFNRDSNQFEYKYTTLRYSNRSNKTTRTLAC
ncbi:hypothetical protein CEXT_314831 [Caerostris extrusa]|uniref:Uncharacterized protein n=1 Tax=Caerostris extrusa TaxID=172846 RepID=A0AAV4N6N1_CAEEX|nr:hypothetical protein CEXT_314831 [Caerostris extrusa]